MTVQSIPRIPTTVRLTVVLTAAAFAAVMIAPGAAFAANNFHSASATGSTILRGEQTTANVFRIPGTELEVTCSSVTFSGTMEDEESEKLTLHPTYNNEEKTCQAKPIGKAMVATAGCNYALAGEGKGKFSALSIDCEASHSITISPLLCTISIGSQTGSGGEVSYKSSGPEEADLIVTAEVGGNSYKASGAGCKVAGIPAEGTNGVLEAEFTLMGYEDVGGKQGAQTAIWVGPPPRNFHSASATGSTILRGEQADITLFSFSGNEAYVECSSASVNGLMEGQEAKELTLHPVYNNEEKTCSAGFGDTKVTTTGCNYALVGDEPIPGKLAALQIDCAAGHSIQFTTFAPYQCKVSIGSQVVREGVSYSNQNPGGPNERDILVETGVGGIHYTSSGSGCVLDGLPETGTNGLLSSTIKLKGYESHEGIPEEQTGIWVE